MGQSFFSRWAQRKQAVADAQTPEVTDQVGESVALPSTPLSDDMASTQVITPPESAVESIAQDSIAQDVEPLTDADMPEIASLDGNSNVSAFFSEGVSEKLRQKALTALFLKPEFNLRDGLEDYDDDYSNLAEMSQSLASELRQWMQDRSSERVESSDAGAAKVAEPVADQDETDLPIEVAQVEPDVVEADVDKVVPSTEGSRVEVEASCANSTQSEAVLDKMPHIS